MDIPRLSPREYQVLELLVAGGEMFGLQLTRLRPDKLPLGTIYVTLQRMERKGFVTSRLADDSAGGPPRRMYRATARGYRMVSAVKREVAGG
jgi:DNA-binding PadR family transcriptional regulator